ncbi:hypothetical protein PITC_044270 [Penicillium italicum]|uniref:HTH psq-type domain-containing protein n=1 Tax=Penicillium italicum TaxID=40296 RepID=A0A0A2LBN4_PENIT|nr:hypothetical protein PITC_044270 [Penicillium italicum]
MSEQIENLEDQILRATNAFNLNNNTNIAQLAREFSVPYQRLRAVFTGAEVKPLLPA